MWGELPLSPDNAACLLYDLDIQPISEARCPRTHPEGEGTNNRLLGLTVHIQCLQSPRWPVFHCGTSGSLSSFSETAWLLAAGVADVT